jgi:ParB-like chromosome segregation protein Spo0J
MKLSINHQAFEFPDEWINLECVSRFNPEASTYIHHDADNRNIIEVSIDNIKAPLRNRDVRWFGEDRMLPILRGITSHRTIPAIEVIKNDDGEYEYHVYDGFHRYYASVVLGYKFLPVVVISYSKIAL